MRKEITRFLELIRYSDSELPEIFLGFLMGIITVVPERLHWMPTLAQVILAGIGLARIFASLSCSLPIRHAFNLACVILFSAMLAAEVHHEGPGDELFLFSVATVSIWCLYRTNYEINSRIDINKGK
jgi:hypothetical protein